LSGAQLALITLRMSAVCYPFLAVLLAGLGARDQVLLAGLSRSQGRRPGVLLTGLVIAIATAVFAVWLAAKVAPLLAPGARLLTVSIALAFAGAEALWPFAIKQPKEPTASLGALGIILLAHQLTDAARLVIFALVVALPTPVTAGLAGAVAGGVSIAAGWMLPEVFSDPRMRLARGLVGAFLLLAALIIGFQALTA
jgi:hypothetical protein